MSTILGDAIHNLRAALDHAYCELVTINGGVVDRYTTFPFHKDRGSLEGSINGNKAKGKGPSDLAIAKIVEDIQPYEGGAYGLYGLHQLDITDKHSVLIPTTINFYIERLDFLDASGKPTGGGVKTLSLFGRMHRKQLVTGLASRTDLVRSSTAIQMMPLR